MNEANQPEMLEAIIEIRFFCRVGFFALTLTPRK